MIDAVDMRETVVGCGPGDVFIHENRVNWGPVVPTGGPHPSPPGAVLQQTRESKLAAGERPATLGTRSPRFGIHPITTILTLIVGKPVISYTALHPRFFRYR